MKDYSKLKKFNHINTEINAAYHDAALRLGLTDSAMFVIYTVCNNGRECTLEDIRRLSGMSKQTINSAIRKLEADGTVMLVPIGGRKKKVCLTDDGIAFAEKTVMKIINIENDIYEAWAKEEWSIYIRLTERFLRDFKLRTKSL